MSLEQSPIKSSPVHHQLVALGATFEPVSGWQVAQHFGESAQEAESVRLGVGLADLSFLPKWEIRGVDTGTFLKGIENESVPGPGSVKRTPSGCLCRVSPNHALWVLEAESAFNPIGNMEESVSGCVHVMDRTSGYALFLLCGPKATRVLSKLASVDLGENSLPDLACRSGPVAAIQAMLIRRDRSRLAGYEILLHREYAEYLWDAVIEAGRPFQIHPFGLAALRQLES